MDLLTTGLLLVFITGLSGEVCPPCTGGVRQDCCQWQCFGSRGFLFFCEDGAVINITGAEFGVSKCSGYCCAVKGDCRVPVVDYKPERMDHIYKQCDGKSDCEYLQVDRVAGITECNDETSDYEIIYFDCVPKHPMTTAATTITTISTSPVEKTASGAPSWGIQIGVIIPLLVFSFWYGN